MREQRDQTELPVFRDFLEIIEEERDAMKLNSLSTGSVPDNISNG